VAFSSDGRTLVVTERGTDSISAFCGRRARTTGPTAEAEIEATMERMESV
jgi:hypothetical protein